MWLGVFMSHLEALEEGKMIMRFNVLEPHYTHLFSLQKNLQIKINLILKSYLFILSLLFVHHCYSCHMLIDSKLLQNCFYSQRLFWPFFMVEFFLGWGWGEGISSSLTVLKLSLFIEFVGFPNQVSFVCGAGALWVLIQLGSLLLLYQSI